MISFSSQFYCPSFHLWIDAASLFIVCALHIHRVMLRSWTFQPPSIAAAMKYWIATEFSWCGTTNGPSFSCANIFKFVLSIYIILQACAIVKPCCGYGLCVHGYIHFLDVECFSIFIAWLTRIFPAIDTWIILYVGSKTRPGRREKYADRIVRMYRISMDNSSQADWQALSPMHFSILLAPMFNIWWT